jgi:preprotein translocase subunit SecA
MSSSNKKVISLEKTATYINDLKKHLKELSSREFKVLESELEESVADKQNTESILAFHENITKLLNYCNIRIQTNEEKIQEKKLEKILRYVIAA